MVDPITANFTAMKTGWITFGKIHAVRFSGRRNFDQWIPIHQQLRQYRRRSCDGLNLFCPFLIEICWVELLLIQSQARLDFGVGKGNAIQNQIQFKNAILFNK